MYAFTLTLPANPLTCRSGNNEYGGKIAFTAKHCDSLSFGIALSGCNISPLCTQVALSMAR